jgi:hypothetical protein
MLFIERIELVLEVILHVASVSIETLCCIYKNKYTTEFEKKWEGDQKTSQGIQCCCQTQTWMAWPSS